MSRLEFLQAKIVDEKSALLIVNQWKMKGNNVVFTNGCFDILHQGHVVYLAKAAQMGQKMVVAVNSDNSVRKQQKGAERPINNEESRCTVLAALGFVDLVVVFDGETPLNLIQQLNPDILVKGADYDPSETDVNSKKYIVGSDVVRENGGSVKVVDLEEGFSTTAIVNRMKKSEE